MALPSSHQKNLPEFPSRAISLQVDIKDGHRLITERSLPAALLSC
jgi:hypothetical protein